MTNKLKLRICSDLHAEHNPNYQFPHDAKQGKNQILILAGDTYSSSGIIKFIRRFHETRFKKVLFIAGNHEFYQSYFTETLKKLKKNFPVKEPLNKITFLDNNRVDIEGATFLGCTLWSDFHKEDPIAMDTARGCMNDYHLIRHDSSATGDTYAMGFEKLTPEDTLKEHKMSRRFLEEELKLAKEENRNNRTVVITHQAPCELSVAPEFKATRTVQLLNGAYYTDLSEMILDYEPALWIHGHMHSSFDYMLGKTRIICNPQGYKSDPNHGFQKELIIEI